MRSESVTAASVLKIAARRALRPVLGKARFQPAFETLHGVALAGLNIGEGNNPLASGEAAVLRFVGQRLLPSTRPLVVFDVGANVGVYTRLVADTLGDAALVHAFEPAAAAFASLTRNVGSLPNVRLHRLGFGREEASAKLHSAGPGSKLGSVYDPSERLRRAGLDVASVEVVGLTTLDAFCARERVEWIHLLKLDVEGHELPILEGGRRMLDEGRIGCVQFEFGAANLDSRTFLRDFFDLFTPEYALHRVLQDGVYPVERYRETYEVYKRATNYLAVRRPLLAALRGDESPPEG